MMETPQTPISNDGLATSKNEVAQEIQHTQATQTKNPWVEFAGVFQDDPDFADIAASIRAERDEEEPDDECSKVR